MDRKTLFIILCGVLAAGIVCLIVGLIVFLAVKNNVVSMLVSLFAIISGALMAAIAGVALLIIFIVNLVKKSKSETENKSKDE